MRAFDASNPLFPHACRIGDAIDEDDKGAGLDYASGGNTVNDIELSLKDIAGRRVSGCVGVDFGSPFALDPIVVRARKTSTGSACRETCDAVEAPALPTLRRCSTCDAPEGSGSFCDRNGKLLVFAGVRVSELEEIGSSSTVTAVFENLTFEAKRPVQLVVVCRGQDGPATPDIEVDVIKSNAPCP
jgi:hypothetical protein